MTVRFGKRRQGCRRNGSRIRVKRKALSAEVRGEQRQKAYLLTVAADKGLGAISRLRSLNPSDWALLR